MADRITVIGPVRDWVDDIADEEDGETFPGYWQKMVFVEATGTDGMVYAKSFAFGDAIDEKYIPSFIEAGRNILEQSMRADGVW